MLDKQIIEFDRPVVLLSPGMFCLAPGSAARISPKTNAPEPLIVVVLWEIR